MVFRYALITQSCFSTAYQNCITRKTRVTVSSFPYLHKYYTNVPEFYSTFCEPLACTAPRLICERWRGFPLNHLIPLLLIKAHHKIMVLGSNRTTQSTLKQNQLHYCPITLLLILQYLNKYLKYAHVPEQIIQIISFIPRFQSHQESNI